MSIPPSALVGSIVISVMVGCGVWYANDPELQKLDISHLLTSAAPQPQGGSVNFLEWSADGNKLLALSRGKAGALARLSLHDLTRKMVTNPVDSLQDVVSCAALAPDGRHVLVGSMEGRLWWIDPDSSDAAIHLVDLCGAAPFVATAISADGLQAAGGTDRGSIWVCDLTRQTCVTLRSGGQTSTTSLRYSPDGRWLVSAHADGRIILWDLAANELSREFLGHRDLSVAAQLLPDGRRIISAGLDSTVRIWDVATGREAWQGEFGLSGITAMAVSPDGMTAAWGGFNHRLIVWNLESGQKKFDIEIPAFFVFHIQFSPDGLLLAVAGTEGLIRLYDMQTAAEQKGIDVTGAIPTCRSAD